MAAVVALAVALSLVDARRDSATADEPIHVAASVAQVAHGSWTVNVEQAPLAKELYGRAALAAGAGERPPLSYRSFFRSARAQLFSTDGGRDPEMILLAARSVAVALFAALVAVTAAAAAGGRAGNGAGWGAALLAAALLAGQTALFPHGHLVTTDIPATLFIVLTVWAAAAALERPSVPLFLATALATALGLATKPTALLLLAFVPLAFLGRAVALRRVEEPREGRLLLAGAFLVPVLSVGLLALLLHPLTSGDPPGTLATLARIYGLGPADLGFLSGIEKVSRGLARYALSVLFVLRQTGAGRLSYFLGEVSTEPAWGYHVVALVAKSPLVWLVAVGSAAVVTLRRRPDPLRGLVLLGAGLFFLVLSLPGPRIGVRHVFPALALLTAGAASVLAPLLRSRGEWLLGAAALLALSPLALGRSVGEMGLLGSLSPVPPLADSNLDWGQDLLRLRDLLRSMGIPPSSVGIAYFGGDQPSFRIPGSVDLLEADASAPRYLAVSRQYLLLGSEAALFPEARPRLARHLAGLGRDVGRPLARAGDSIELFEPRTGYPRSP